MSVAPCAAQELPATFRSEPVEASAGDGLVVRGERGLLPVPLVRGDPASRTIHVEVHRFRALDGAAAGTPPIFFLNGGPGWPGLGGSVRNPGWVRAMLVPFARVADVVFVGQRGIGSSPPNTACDPPAPAAGEDPAAGEREAALRDAAARCRSRWEAEGYDLRGFNVIEAAADVRDAARALGYDRIQLVGGSFGSHWGMAVLRFHPDLVERALLAALEGPDHTYDDPGGVLAALGRIAAAAEADPRLAPAMPEGGLLEGLRRLIRALETEPREVRPPNTTTSLLIRAADVRRLALGYTGSTSSRAGIRTWPADMLRLIHGDWSGAALRIAFGRRVYGPMPTASFFMLDCGSGITAERHARYAADPAHEIVGDPGAFYDLACPAWDADLGDGFRLGFTTAVPTLLVHGTWDTSTPLENARELAPAFTNSRLVIVEGGSHGALREALDADAGFRAAAFDFLATGSLAGIPANVRLPPLDFAVPDLPQPSGAGLPLDRLAWLAGCWTRGSDDRGAEEQWMRPRGGLMLGMSRTMRAGRAVAHEALRIEQRGDDLVYVALPSGQALAEFPATEVTESGAVFENPAHDFPQRILYRRGAADSLFARIEGVSGGQERGVDFRFGRVACPGR